MATYFRRLSHARYQNYQTQGLEMLNKLLASPVHSVSKFRLERLPIATLQCPFIYAG